MRLKRAIAAAGVAVLTACAGGSPHGGRVTLTVVGTSDVYDSHLVQSVLKPQFEKAHPDIELRYVSKGTGAAIAYAKEGTAGALLVHAASLENRFVADGYSAEPFGRAVFVGDYVLVGPASDPAGILAGAPHDIAGAFRRVAAAGAAGRASFVSRGGTPGTTVQEHRIWALIQGVSRCPVSAADGGGAAPSAPSGRCSGSPSRPSWYHVTGLTQGPNLINAEACNYRVRGCYAFTDRGTFDYLATTGAVRSLRVVTRDNAASAPGGPALLVSSFHAYAVEPGRFDADVAARLHPAAARAFVAWLAGPAAQRAVAGYLADTGTAPFRPSAAPLVEVTPLPATARPGEALTVEGALRNAVMGAPALAGETVSVLAREQGSSPRIVATAITDADGRFRTTVVARRGVSWTLVTDAITKVEEPALAPPFADLLAPAEVDLGAVGVTRG